MALLKCLKSYSKDGLPDPICSVPFRMLPFNRYTRQRNMEKLRVIKFPELKKFCVLTKFAKLKLIEHFAHATLVTMKYS